MWKTIKLPNLITSLWRRYKLIYLVAIFGGIRSLVAISHSIVHKNVMSVIFIERNGFVWIYNITHTIRNTRVWFGVLEEFMREDKRERAYHRFNKIVMTSNITPWSYADTNNFWRLAIVLDIIGLRTGYSIADNTNHTTIQTESGYPRVGGTHDLYQALTKHVSLLAIKDHRIQTSKDRDTKQWRITFCKLPMFEH